MTLEHVLGVLEADLAARGRLSLPHNLPPLDLAFKLLSEYVKYPLPPTAVIPFNFCVLFPRESWITKTIC